MIDDPDSTSKLNSYEPKYLVIKPKEYLDAKKESFTRAIKKV